MQNNQEIFIPSELDLWIHGLITNTNPRVLKNLIYLCFPIGIIAWWKARETFKKEFETMQRIINSSPELGLVFEKYSAEHDGTTLIMYHYASDEMLSWDDARVIKSVKTFMYNEVYRHFINGGASSMFADNLHLVAQRVNLDDLGEMRGYAQSNEIRCVEVRVSPTYLGVPQRLLRTTIKSFFLCCFVVAWVFILLYYLL